MKRLGVILIMILAVSLPSVSFGNTLSAFGKATLDGVMSPGEWDKAAKVDFLADVPGGGTVPATLFVMNDEANIYLAVKFAQSSYGKLVQFIADFDNNDNGFANDGEDVIAMYVGSSMPLTFVDAYHYSCPDAPAGSAGCLAQDDDTNGAVAALNDGSVTIIEMSHPLESADSLHDFNLNPGSMVGLRAILTIYSASTVVPAVGSGSNYDQVQIALHSLQAVIDIKPGNRMNSINRSSEGKIPVAILSSVDFNALAQVDRSSLTFGRTGEEGSLAFCNAGSEDVNGDGLPDLICHFSTKLSGFQPGDNSGILKGRTTDGTMFTAKDFVRIVH